MDKKFRNKITKWFNGKFDVNEDLGGQHVETKDIYCSVTDVIRDFFKECVEDM